MQPHDPTRSRCSPATAGAESLSEGLGVLVRLGWLLGGTLTTLIAWFTVVSSPASTFGVGNVVLWSGAALAVASRYWDIARFRGRTSRGEPATTKNFWRYLAGLSAMALGAWTAAQSVHL